MQAGGALNAAAVVPVARSRIAGALILALCVFTLADAPLPLGWLFVSLLALAAGWFALKMPGVPVYLSISDTFHITSCLLFGPAPATLTIALDSLGMSVRRGNPAHQVLFNTDQLRHLLVDRRTSLLLAVRYRPATQCRCGPGRCHDAARADMAVVYFVVQLRPHRRCRRASETRVCPAHLATALRRRGVQPSCRAARHRSSCWCCCAPSARWALAAVLPLLVIFQLPCDRGWAGSTTRRSTWRRSPSCTCRRCQRWRPPSKPRTA